jgi:hypothetical protein
MELIPNLILLKIFDLIEYPISLVLTCKKWMNLILEPGRMKEKREKLGVFIRKDRIIHAYIGKEVTMWVIDKDDPFLLLPIKRSNLITKVEYIYPPFHLYSPSIYLDFTFIIRPRFRYAQSQIQMYTVEIDGYQFYFDPRVDLPLFRVISRETTTFYDRHLNLKRIDYLSTSIFLKRGKICIRSSPKMRKVPFLVWINGRRLIHKSFLKAHEFEVRKEALVFPLE